MPFSGAEINAALFEEPLYSCPADEPIVSPPVVYINPLPRGVTEDARAFAFVAVVAVAAFPVQEPEEPETLPVMLAFIVDGSFNVVLAEPLIDTAAPVLVPSESAI